MNLPHLDSMTPQAQWDELVRLLATGVRRLFDRLARTPQPSLADSGSDHSPSVKQGSYFQERS